ncbi:MAG TPA: YopJ family acetyltransferase [Duganella sp.]|nr:YopJ family acetyltransferase [Duganella sp.]
MTNWTNYRNPAHLDPFDTEAFNRAYREQSGQASHASAQSSPSRAGSRTASPELQPLRGQPGARHSSHAAERPPRAPSQGLLQKLRTATSMMASSPGTRTDHELHWQSIFGQQSAPPFHAVTADYPAPAPWGHDTAPTDNAYMPALSPLPTSAWDQWMAEDDLALQAAAAAYGDAHIAQMSHAAPAESAHIQHARANLGGMLHSALAKLEALSHANTDPEIAGFPIKQLDHEITPLLIASENWRRPQLNLVALHTSEACGLDSDDDDEDDGELSPMRGSQNIDDFVQNAPYGRYRALIDNGQHTRAADIYKGAGAISVVVLDSLRVEKDPVDYEDYAVNLKQDFGQHARCAFIPLDLQKSAFGCRVFSMSLALKMQSREGEFNGIHNALHGNADLASVVPHRQQTEDDRNAYVVLNAGGLIDARMMKHSESRSSIERYLNANPSQKNAIVNNTHGETLKQRTKRHTIKREVLDKKDSGNKTKDITYNNSIELKRIALVKRALNFVSMAPPEEVLRLSALINDQ